MKELETLRNIVKYRKIEKVYQGKDSGCRCGCNGRYYYPSDDLDDEMYMVLQQALETAEIEGVGIKITDDWINISYGNDMAYTIYYEGGKYVGKDN